MIFQNIDENRLSFVEKSHHKIEKDRNRDTHPPHPQVFYIDLELRVLKKAWMCW